MIVVTASNGKTTLLHLLESQIGNKARYSHHANSAFGIPFDILGIHRKSYRTYEWPLLFFQAPLALLTPPPAQHIYVVEADCDRPREGKFLAELLRPNITLWLNVSLTHSQNFDHLVGDKQFSTIEAAISHEFGYFPEYTKEKVYANGDSALIRSELKRATASIECFSEADWLTSHKVSSTGTCFQIKHQAHTFPSILLPKEAWLSIVMCLSLCRSLHIPYDYSYIKFRLPPGRSTLYKGIKHTTIIDSSYNSNFESTKSMLQLFNRYPAEKKWIVLGDMVELGKEEDEEHRKLGELLANLDFHRLIMIGPRLEKFALPLLKQRVAVTQFSQPREARKFILDNLSGGETLLFKGSRFLEGIIEHLLAEKEDVETLCRREEIWQKRRRQWGL